MVWSLTINDMVGCPSLYLKMRGVQGEALVLDFGCAVSRLLYIVSLGFLCLSYIIGVCYGGKARGFWGSGLWGLGCGRGGGLEPGFLFAHPLIIPNKSSLMTNLS